MSKLQIVYKPLSEIYPYKNNPRKNDTAVEAVAKSIKEFGFKAPIIIDGKSEIVAGHTRLKAAKQLGLKEVPCVVADDLTDEQIKAFRIADNSTAQIAEWDFDLLNIELQDIDFDMSDFGLSGEIAEVFEIETEAEEEQGVEKRLLKCPVCGHLNEEKAFKNYEDTD